MKNIFKIAILLFSYVSISIAQEDYITKLDNAIIKNADGYKILGFDLDAIKYAIEEGNLDPSNPRVLTLIRSIIRNDNKLEVLPYLATKFGDSKFIDKEDDPILPTVALLTNFDVVRYLVENFQYIDINAINDFGLTALQECLRKKGPTNSEKLDMLEYLIVRGARLPEIGLGIINISFCDYGSGMGGIAKLLYRSSKITQEHIRKDYLKRQLGKSNDSADIAMWFLQNGVDIDYNDSKYVVDKLKEIYKLIDRSLNFTPEEDTDLQNSSMPLFKKCQDAFKSLLMENNISKIKKIDAMYIRMLFNYCDMTNLIIDLIKSKNYNEQFLILLLNKIGQVYNLNKLQDSNGNNLLSYALESQKTRIAALLLILCPSLINNLEFNVPNLPEELTNIRKYCDNKNYPVSVESSSLRNKIVLSGAAVGILVAVFVSYKLMLKNK